MMDDNLLSSSVVVTSGKDKLDSIPTVKTVGNTAQLKVKFKDTYDTKEVTSKIRVRFTAKKDIYLTNIYSFEWYDGAEWVKKYATTQTAVDGSDGVDDKADADGLSYQEYVDLQKVIKNSDLHRSLKLVEGETLMLKKGDTITCPEFEINGNYLDITDYGDTLTVTPKEVDDRYIIADGEDLYDNAGSSDKVTIYFGSTGDVAALNFKVSSAQKDLNLFYKTDEIEDVTDAYPNVDFEFITFYAQNSGANVLTNSGTMTFNAIGGKNTTVYEWNGKTLTELNSKYDSVDDTVVVDGIKRLTTYVVSEKKLEAKVEETEAPATETNAPVTEPVTAPEPSTPSDNNENPNTGAL